MKVDRFWKFFWLGTGGMTIIGLSIALSLFVFFTQQGDLLAAVGVSYQAGKDPFENGGLLGVGGSAISLPSGYLYQNSLPLNFKSWTWEAIADWRSTDQTYEGSYVLKANITSAGGTVGMNGPSIDLTGMKSISLAVYVDDSVGDAFLNLYDKNGNALTMQSLGWYASTSTLTPNTWETVTIPLSNFGDLTPGTISGFSISGKNPGTVYIDSIQLSKKDVAHAAWVAPPPSVGAPFNPFATSTPVALPYTFTPTPDALIKWYTYFGDFGLGSSGEVELGPSAVATTTGSMTVFRGGRNWGDYHEDTTIDWGQAAVFSLLARFISDGDFVSCAFSRYGETAQLYQVSKGTSTFISQTPPLAVKDYEPWVDVNMGMEVQGDQVACFIDGNEVLRATLPTMPSTGSVGFETWDSNPDAAPHTLHSFVVTPLLSNE